MVVIETSKMPLNLCVEGLPEPVSEPRSAGRGPAATGVVVGDWLNRLW